MSVLASALNFLFALWLGVLWLAAIGQGLFMVGAWLQSRRSERSAMRNGAPLPLRHLSPVELQRVWEGLGGTLEGRAARNAARVYLARPAGSQEGEQAFRDFEDMSEFALSRAELRRLAVAAGFEIHPSHVSL